MCCSHVNVVGCVGVHLHVYLYLKEYYTENIGPSCAHLWASCERPRVETTLSYYYNTI